MEFGQKEKDEIQIASSHLKLCTTDIVSIFLTMEYSCLSLRKTPVINQIKQEAANQCLKKYQED